MAEKRGRKPPAGRKAAAPPPETAAAVLDDPASDASLSEPQLARLRLRQRWEMASVLNFLHVFKELIEDDSEISAEEIETALITPNVVLAQIHINLLKGIPPVTKNMMDADAWVTIVCKKLATWWPWVAEGENPLKADHGEEIARYRELDPTTRLLILKALCEVRALQDDILRYITDALKNGTPITAFRKERIGGDDDGITYWYDGDPVVGYRLYREISRVESKQKLKGKGHSAQPTIESRWETLATNLEEFLEISDNLSSSKIAAEASVGEIIKTDIVPVLEELQKKKEKALKRQQRQGILLDGFLYSGGIESRHSRRERKPVKYTFDEYDQCIEEAIQISKNSKTSQSQKDSNKQRSSSPDEVHGTLPEVNDVDKHRGQAGDDDDEDDDYDEKDDRDGSDADDDDENDVLGDSDEEDGLSRRTHSGGAARNQKDVSAKVAVGLRRSSRTADSTNGTDFGAYRAEAKGHPEMKKRLRQRPTRNTDYSVDILSDSEDESSSEANKQTESVLGPESEASTSATASDEDCSDEDSGNDGNDDDDEE